MTGIDYRYVHEVLKGLIAKNIVKAHKEQRKYKKEDAMGKKDLNKDLNNDIFLKQINLPCDIFGCGNSPDEVCIRYCCADCPLAEVMRKESRDLKKNK